MQALHELIHQRGTIVGTFCALGSVEAVEVACHAGYDFVIVDGQHGAFEVGDLREALRAIQATACFPIARIPAQGLFTVEALLDAGYPALLAPMVNTPAHAGDLVAATHYPPSGHRSQSGCRANLQYGPDYRRRFNEAFSLLVMIEHADALPHVESIAGLPGVAGCFIGGTDLASSLGEGATDALDAAIARVGAATRAAGKIAGIAAPNVEAARRYAAQGFQVITIATDRRLLSGAMADITGAWRAGAV